jgi:hypothetical protein
MARVMGSVLSPVLGGFSSLLAPLRPTPGPPALPLAGVHHPLSHVQSNWCIHVLQSRQLVIAASLPMHAIANGYVCMQSLDSM